MGDLISMLLIQGIFALLLYMRGYDLVWIFLIILQMITLCFFYLIIGED